MVEYSTVQAHSKLPEWVPTAAQVYLAHTESGFSIRELARKSGCHASTVSRQVRRMETRRDDPLIDAALRKLGRFSNVPKARNRTATDSIERDSRTMNAVKPDTASLDEDTLAQEARRVLRRLCEAGAVLAVAAEMDKAVVVRDTGEGGNTRTAIVDARIAEAMALKDWIACEAPARISRYRITSAGRSALSRLMARQENRVRGFAEAQAGFASGAEAGAALERVERDPRARRGRYLLAESPLTVLARRRDKDGVPFLDEKLVAAGERLREDFELIQISGQHVLNCDDLLELCNSCDGDQASDAQLRLRAAIRELGPGLGDVALRCCCYLAGLEATEKELGWSARSGKIVLRIALQRLRRHYDRAALNGGDLLG